MRRFEGFSHGVNLGGWLSQCNHTKERYDTFITEDDIKVIKGWGLDHVRLPIDYDLVEDDAGNYKPEGFEYIEKAVEWTGNAGLNMIIDLHKTYGFSFDVGENEKGFFENESYQERFYRLWEELAGRFGKYSDRVAFELLNEVTEKEYCETWNRISKECIKRIRKNAPETRILVGSYYYNSIYALKDLEKPVDDKVVYNFHCYEPFIFTHQGAGWMEGMNKAFRMPFESTYGEYEKNIKENLEGFSESMGDFDKSKIIGIEFFEKLVNEAVRVAEERNVPLYCGEFGVIDKADATDALKWYRMICSCFEKHGIGRAAWSYKEMDFGLSDARMDPVRDEILKVL